jgi:hypothetical protein
VAPVAWLAALAYVVYFAGMVVMHFLTTGRSALYHTVSDYSVGKYGALARAMTSVNVLATVLLLIAFWTMVASPPLALTGLYALAVVAACRFGMIFILTDESGTRLTAQGRAHAALAVLSFVAAISAVTILTRNLHALAVWQQVLPVLGILSSAAFPLVLLLALSLVPVLRLRGVFGLLERLFLADVNLWFLIAAGVLAIR